MHQELQPGNQRGHTHSRGRWLVACAFLALQVIIPLGYYLQRADSVGRRDERFRWRMFSVVRLQRCSPFVSYRDSTARWQFVDLTSHFQSSWVTLISRQRPQVVRKALRHLCDRVPGDAVRFHYPCAGWEANSTWSRYCR